MLRQVLLDRQGEPPVVAQERGVEVDAIGWVGNAHRRAHVRHEPFVGHAQRSREIGVEERERRVFADLFERAQVLLVQEVRAGNLLLYDRPPRAYVVRDHEIHAGGVGEGDARALGERIEIVDCHADLAHESRVPAACHARCRREACGGNGMLNVHRRVFHGFAQPMRTIGDYIRSALAEPVQVPRIRARSERPLLK